MRLAEKEMRDILERAFQAYREQLKTVTSFKYLGRVLTTGDDNCTAVSGNLRKDRKIWMQMTRILRQEGGGPEGLRIIL